MTFLHRLALLSFSFSHLLLSFGSSPVEYDISTLNRLNNAVTQYLTISTQQVSQRAGTKDDVAQSFEKEFLQDDAYPEEEISEEKKNNVCMKVVQHMLSQEGASTEKLNALEFKENTALSLHNKEMALIAAYDSYWMKKWGLGIVVGMGASIIAIGSIAPKNAKIPVAGVGTLIGAAGTVGLYSIAGEQQLLKTHINQINTMKTSWQFKLKKR